MPDLCAPARRAALREALAAVARGQQVDNFDLPLVRGDGVSGQFSVNLSPISGEDGRVSSIVVVMTDVTDSAMLRSKLVHAEKMAAVGQLVSGVAHEVNNPLTAILGFTDLLMENPELPESARRDLRVILQEAQRTKQIVQNLLSFARQMPPQRQPVQLNSILQRTVQLRSYDFISHGIQVVERLDESLPQVIGDSHQLQQVFLNILNNAYDAVRESGAAGPHRDHERARRAFVEISFRDNGLGIADPGPHFRSVLHHQGRGQRHGPGPEHLLWHCPRTWRRNSLSQQSGLRRSDFYRSPSRGVGDGILRSSRRSTSKMTQNWNQTRLCAGASDRR